jgi:hypothetical protein
MTAVEIKQLIVGKSLYFDLETASGKGVGTGTIYYTAGGKATLKFLLGEPWHGTWTMKDNTVCIDWNEMPNNPCTHYDKQGDTITINNVATGKPPGKLVKIVEGNPENL